MSFEKPEAVGSEAFGPMMLKPKALSKKLHAEMLRGEGAFVSVSPGRYLVDSCGIQWARKDAVAHSSRPVPTTIAGSGSVSVLRKCQHPST